uniref:CSON011604 protein n=2 Tax=Culicoides sonorensis TaxID=179676 RepID=A0A336LSS3_CULSO
MMIRIFLLYLGLCLSLLIQSMVLANCYGIDYCERVENYPFDEIRNAVNRNLTKFKMFFGVEELEKEQTTVGVDNRIDRTEHSNLCDAQRFVIYPQSGFSIDGSFSYILNFNNNTKEETNIIQGIAIEKCTKSYRYLLSFENGGIVKKAFQLPSHCKCTIRRQINN